LPLTLLLREQHLLFHVQLLAGLIEERVHRVLSLPDGQLPQEPAHRSAGRGMPGTPTDSPH
jgi:hypothetical protein